MGPASPADCARCGTILDAHFRFCPECALPVSGDGVLSTQIAELRRRVEADSGERPVASWRRYLLPTAATAMLAFVVVTGLVLFNRPLLFSILPASGLGQAATVAPHAPRWEPEWRPIPAGTFPYGRPSEGRRGQIPYTYRISRYEVRNALWLEYLTSERENIRKIGLWQESFPRGASGWKLDAAGNARLDPERRQYPVTNISPLAAAEFCAWLTRRLGEPAFEIRMPTQLEWERAARGDGTRLYTWGDDDIRVPIPQSGFNTRPRAGIGSSAYAVDDPQLAADDTSQFDVVGMGTNASEWVLMPDFYDRLADQPEREIEDFLDVGQLRESIEQQQVNVTWRGASHACDIEDARRFATGWDKISGIADKRESRLDTGLRLVKVNAAR